MPNDTVPASGEAVPMIYPDIQRRDGTLFFAVHEASREEISTSIERLIDMLDAMDGDENLEESGDEHDTGMPDGWRGTSIYFDSDNPGPILEDDEEEASGYGDNDGMNEGERGEYSLGWTAEVNQDVALAPLSCWQLDDGEPELGWTGHGRGWVEGTSLADTEANGDELDLNGDEKDYSGYPGEFDCSGGSDFDGSGTDSAVAMLRAIGVSIEAPEGWIPVSEPGTLFLKVRT